MSATTGPVKPAHPKSLLLRTAAAEATEPWAGHLSDAAAELDRQFLILRAGHPQLDQSIDDLFQTIGPLKRQVGEGPSVETPPAAALAFYSDDHDKFHLWLTWKRINEVMGHWDARKKEVDPQPKGGRSMS